MGIYDGNLSNGEDEPFRNRECYEFNNALEVGLDDARCAHCLHFMTIDCPHIDEFIGGEGN